MAIVQVKDLRKTYPLGKVQVEAVKGVDFSIERGEFVSISGPSGSGKSTILNMIGLIDTPTSGSLIINDENIYGEADFTSLSKNQNKKVKIPGRLDKKMTSLRHEYLGFIFQSFNLIPVLNVYENIEFPLLFGAPKGTKEQMSEWIDYLIEKVGLTEWKHHKSNELSGGQRQRVAIARALSNHPPLILADEPTGNLDSQASVEIMELFAQLNAQGNTVIVVTHEDNIAQYAHRILTFNDGVMISDEINQNPTPITEGGGIHRVS